VGLLAAGRRQVLSSLAAYHARELGWTMDAQGRATESPDADAFVARVREAAAALEVTS